MARKASRSELKTLLGVWGVTLLLPYAKMFAPMLGYTGNFGNMGLYGVCDWNEFGTFYYVSGIRGYPRAGILPGEIPARMGLAPDTGRLYPDVHCGLPDHGLRIRRPAKPLPGQLRVP